MTENKKKKEKKPLDTRRLIRQITGVLVGIIMMGFSISWLVPCGFGTDGYTAMNLAISGKIGWSFGTWQAALNCVLFVVVILFDKKLIGLGTLANMILVSIPSINIQGAVVGSFLSNIIMVLWGFIVLKKEANIKKQCH